MKNNFITGYIALVSAVIISVLLMTIVVALNFSGFFGRFNILDGEYKRRSAAAAEGCVNIAMLKLAIDASYAGNNYFALDDSQCLIAPITAAPPAYKIVAQASTTATTRQKSVTNLKVEVTRNPGPPPLVSVTSWRECQTLAICSTL